MGFGRTKDMKLTRDLDCYEGRKKRGLIEQKIFGKSLVR